MTHSLSDKDLAEMTAECAVCETRVPIRKSGNGYRCAVKLADKHRAWAEANPAKAAANRRPGVDHQIIGLDRLTQTGFCTVCEKDVSLVPHGKGWVCQNRMDAQWPAIDSADFDWHGFSVTGPWADPYEMPAYESAVPGWKTIGALE